MIKFLTAGESHGKNIIGIIEGLPANLYIYEEYINKELSKRQKGYGRGKRMEIEKDKIEILSGINNNKTTGGPISISIKNKGNDIDLVEIKEPRPGHADLAGLLKYNQEGGRNILERASARETAMRVAIGSISKLFLKEFDIEIYSHVISIGNINSDKSYYKYDVLKEINNREKTEMNVIDNNIEKLFIEEIKNIENQKDTVGGEIELIGVNIPVGLGSHISWDRKLDGLLAQSLMSIQGIKGLEIGMGFAGVNILGSNYHDEIIYKDKYKRLSNFAGGIEGGISNGEDIVIKIIMKPIPTLKKPLKTVNIDTKEEKFALVERGDTCAVPAASIVAESMMAITIANEFLIKFGGDSMEEIKNNYNSYLGLIEKKVIL